MRMLVRVPFVIVAFSAMWYIALAKSRFGGPTTVAPERRWMIETTTTGSPGQNLEGKMFTLSRNSGGIAFYSPYFMPSTTQPYPTTSTGTTAPTVTGVSVCLRYLTDPGSIPSFFRLGSASSYSLYLDLQDTYNYKLGLNYGHTLTFQPNKMFGAPPAMPWTSLCLTVDNKKKVAQVFSGSKMSIRKLMPGQMVWSGEPVIEFSSFNGQLTDVQVWDYPISYPDVLSYIYRDFYWTQRGSVITWSSINYSLRGNALLEDSFEKQRSEVGRKRTQKKFLRAQKWQL